MSKKEPFWRAGIRFACQGSGHCCTARRDYGYIYLENADAERLARFLGLSRAELEEKHCATTDGYLHLRDPEKDCAFLTPDRRCAVYEARPEQCRTWPFWPENLRQREDWNREVVKICSGVGKGRLYTADEIAAILARQNEEE